MADLIFPFLYKPGIARDGTDFQPEYCIDGQWVRFQRGRIKTIGGRKSFVNSYNEIVNATHLNIQKDGDGTVILVCNTQTIKYFKVDKDFDFISQDTTYDLPGNTSNILWSSTTAISVVDKKSYVVFLGTRNRIDINAKHAPSSDFFVYTDVQDLKNVSSIQPNDLPPVADGGLCYAAPFLFTYGSDGQVYYSVSGNPLKFKKDNQIIVGNGEKVIFGAETRGQGNPTLLFWTMTSVVRTTNVGTDTTNFKSDVIARDVSILSSRCVVEYDGLFFWPGMDKFYIYNGTVQTVRNTMSLNYFFDNVDMERRQQVFGVKNPKYEEIWRFYPEKNVPGGNSRALIYNKLENSWYDTAIQADCGTYSNENGFLCTFGRPLVNPKDTSYVWRHEFNQDQSYYDNDNNDALTIEKIPRKVTTPYISFVAFNPTKQGAAVDRWVYLNKFEPDFVMSDPNNDLYLTINTKEFAQSPTISAAPILFNGTTIKLDPSLHGRHMNFTIESLDDFEVGNILLHISEGAGR